MNWNPEQYNELTERYGEMSDAELRRLASAPEDLTEMAEEVLGKEMAARKLSLAPEPEIDDEQLDNDEEWPPEHDTDLWTRYGLKAPPHCTFEFDSVRQAQDAGAFLWQNHVDSQVLQPTPDAIAMQGPRLVVLPRDAERAAQILTQPIPDHIANEPEEVAEEFVTPGCPECGSVDPVLIAIDPVNQWLCEACEHEWRDPAEVESTT